MRDLNFKFLLCFSLFLLNSCSSPFTARTVQQDQGNAKATPPFMRRKCYSCHKIFAEENAGELLRRNYLVAGAPEQSVVYKFTKMGKGDGPHNMPINEAVTQDEIEEFAEWIRGLPESRTTVLPSEALASSKEFKMRSPNKLKEVDIYRRCYQQFTKGRPIDSDSRLRDISEGRMKASDACLSLLKLASLGKNGMIAPAETRGLGGRILKNFQSFHNNWFSSFDYFFGNNDSGTFEILDPGMMGFYLTRSLFHENSTMALRDIFTEKNSLEAIRRHEKKNAFSVNSVKRVELERAFFLTGKPEEKREFWHPHQVERGDLVGIRPIPKGRDVLPKVAHYTADQSEARENSISSVHMDIHQNHGGGILGSEQYLILNNNMGLGITVDGGINVPRLWGKAIIEDFLCRELPVISEQDADRYTQPKSKIPFRRNANCMSCHATMDYMSYVIGNTEKVYSTPMDVDGSNLIKTMHMFIHTPSTKLAAPTIGSEEDSIFHKRPVQGEFIYRSTEGQLLQEKISSIDDLGRILTSLDDFYYCVSKRYFNFLTGIDVNFEKEDGQDVKSRATVEMLKKMARNLKAHQSLAKLVREIIETPFYGDRNYEIEVSDH